MQSAVGYAGNTGGINYDAISWTPSTTSGVNLLGYLAQGTDGNLQVGTSDDNHATVWNGTAASAVDLDPNLGTPTQWQTSYAFGVQGNNAVGTGQLATGLAKHAVVWNLTTASYVDLHPLGFVYSQALGVGGGQEVGDGWNTAVGRIHALLWTGTASSAIDLHPAAFFSSTALVTDGEYQAGYGNLAGPDTHALLWNGTAASVVDLGRGIVFALGDGIQVGLAGAQGIGDITVWSGSAASAVDLSILMPTSYQVSDTGLIGASSSVFQSTLSVDADNNIFAVAHERSTDLYHLVEFTPVPEPSSIVLAALSAIGVAAAVRRKHKHVSRPLEYLIYNEF